MAMRLKLPFSFPQVGPKHSWVGTSILEEEPKGAEASQASTELGIFMRTLSLFNTIKVPIERYFQKLSVPLNLSPAIKSRH
jgi:hypothetical protein